MKESTTGRTWASGEREGSDRDFSMWKTSHHNIRRVVWSDHKGLPGEHGVTGLAKLTSLLCVKSAIEWIFVEPNLQYHIELFYRQFLPSPSSPHINIEILIFSMRKLSSTVNTTNS